MNKGKKKQYITAEDIKRGYKRVNMTISIPAARKLVQIADTKGQGPTTYATLLFNEKLNAEIKKQNNSTELPGQTELFGKGKK